MTTKTTTASFDEFDEELKLDPLERAAAELRHSEITDVLKRAGLVVLAFLQGSFARKTMIAPLRDIDKVVILSHDLRGLHPDELMNRLQTTLAAEYPTAIFDRSRHALQVDFGPETFYFDIVPAWETDGDDDDDVLIANRDSGRWDRSNTRELVRAVAERNQQTGGRFIRQVRMGKHAIRNLLDGLIPGLHIESWAYMVIAESLPHDVACERLLQAGANLLGKDYTEPTGVDLISARLRPDVVTNARPVLERAAQRAAEARRLTEAGDHDEANRLWHAIFGDPFPAPPEQDDGEALRRSFTGGALTSVGTVSTSARVGQRSQPTRSWRSR